MLERAMGMFFSLPGAVLFTAHGWELFFPLPGGVFFPPHGSCTFHHPGGGGVLSTAWGVFFATTWELFPTNILASNLMQDVAQKYRQESPYPYINLQEWAKSWKKNVRQNTNIHLLKSVCCRVWMWMPNNERWSDEETGDAGNVILRRMLRII